MASTAFKNVDASRVVGEDDECAQPCAYDLAKDVGEGLEPREPSEDGHAEGYLQTEHVYLLRISVQRCALKHTAGLMCPPDTPTETHTPKAAAFGALTVYLEVDWGYPSSRRTAAPGNIESEITSLWRRGDIWICT